MSASALKPVVWSVYFPCVSFPAALSSMTGIPYEPRTVSGLDQFRPKSTDLVLFLGGSDLSPQLYHSRNLVHPHTPSYISDRDHLEWMVMNRAINNGIGMIGCCRGGQMLCVGAGGTLIQHVTGHNSGTHPLILSQGTELACNSLHHQMMRLEGTDHELIGWTPARSSVYEVDPVATHPFDASELRGKEPEIVYFPGIRGLAFQYHPEGNEDQPYGRLALALTQKYLLERN